MGRRGMAEERRTEFGIRQQDRRGNAERGTGGELRKKEAGKGRAWREERRGKDAPARK